MEDMTARRKDLFDSAVAKGKEVIDQLQEAALRTRQEIKDVDNVVKNEKNLKKKDIITLLLVKKQMQAKQKAQLAALMKTHKIIEQGLEMHKKVVDDVQAGIESALEEITEKKLLVFESEENTDSKRKSRNTLIKEDLELVSEALGNSEPLADSKTLHTIIEQLHATEATADFQAQLLNEAKSLSSESDYTETNFAYGSTPFATWYSLFKEEPLRSAMLNAAAQGKHHMVWGSSLGWLLYYARLTFGTPGKGYELLQCLVDAGNDVVKDQGIKDVTMHCEDMLNASLDNVAVLVLTSQCWDPELFARVEDKLSSELPEGALVVDYTNQLESCPVFGGSPVLTVAGPVSWNPHQTLYVWRKQASLPSSLVPTRQAGTSGLELSTMGFGCWQLGSKGADDYWGLEYTQEAANAIVSKAVELGVTYMDTAEDYQKGGSELQLGAAIKSLEGTARGKVVIGSKILPNHCDQVRKSCEGTLERLGIECIDLYMVHWPIDKNSMAHFATHGPGPRDYAAVGDVASEEVPPTQAAFIELMKLQKEGKIKHIGVSNFGVKQLKEALATGAKIAVNQLCYNMIFRAAEMEIIPFCQEQGIGVLAYSPLMQGLLTGRWMDADSIPEYRARTRHFHGKRPKSRHGEEGHEDLLFCTLRDIKAACDKFDIPMATAAIAWPLCNPQVTCVICGATKESQLLSNVDSIQYSLPPALVERITAVTEPLKHAMGPNCDLWQGGDNARIA